MTPSDLPERWQAKLADWWKANNLDHHASLGAGAFSPASTVEIHFENGSQATFLYAFVIEAPEFGETAVFTEHCGYHLFRSSAFESCVVVGM